MFSDFMKDARGAGLQFVSESRVVMMSSEDLSPQLNEVLTALDDNLIAREQVIDIVRNRMFRETLLCRESLQLDRGLSSKIFKSLIFVASYIPVEKALDDTESTVRLIERYSGRDISAPNGECAEMLKVLAAFGSEGATFDTLHERSAVNEHECLRTLFTLWKTGFVEALTASISGCRERLEVSPLARKQAVGSGRVTSALHESFNLAPEERAVLAQVIAPMTCAALETLLVASYPRDRVVQLIASVREKGFFL
jgi:hypothetical protein